MHGAQVADVWDLLLHSPHGWAQSRSLTHNVSGSCAIFSLLTHSNTLPPSQETCSAGSTTQTTLIGGQPMSPPVTVTVSASCLTQTSALKKKKKTQPQKVNDVLSNKHEEAVRNTYGYLNRRICKAGKLGSG